MNCIIKKYNISGIDRTCRGDQVYEECGMCPNVCGHGLAERLSCMQYDYTDTGCIPGCQCPDGLYLTDDYRCVTVEECNEGTQEISLLQHTALT